MHHDADRLVLLSEYDTHRQRLNDHRRQFGQQQVAGGKWHIYCQIDPKELCEFYLLLPCRSSKVYRLDLGVAARRGVWLAILRGLV